MKLKHVYIIALVLLVLIVNGWLLFSRMKGKSQQPSPDAQKPQVLSWGYDRFGQLGIDFQKVIDKEKPAAIVSIDQPVVELAAGLGHSLALTENGEVYAWGNNSNGQLGLGGLDNKATPQKLTNLSNIQAIAASQFHSLALDKEGRVWSWGLNWSGQLGDGTYKNSPVPVQVKDLTEVTAIGTGYRFSFALKKDGSVWVWGADCEHNSETEYKKIIESFSGSLDIAGSYFDADESNVDEFNEAANCIGENWINIKSNVPVQLKALSEIKQVSAGYGHLMALKNDGTVWSWGCNKYGQLGFGNLGNTDEVKEPRQIPNIPPIKEISAGFRHSILLDETGRVWGWGHNRWGQVGNENTDDQSSPMLVEGIEKVKSVHAGLDYTLMLDEEGQLWGMGQNSFLKLSAAAPTHAFHPIKLHEGWVFQEILPGAAHTLGIAKQK